METIPINITKNFWPSGSGTSIGWVRDDPETLSERLLVPLFSENQTIALLLQVPGVGPVSLCWEADLGSGTNVGALVVADIIVDSELDLWEAKEILISALSEKVHFEWPSGQRPRNG